MIERIDDRDTSQSKCLIFPFHVRLIGEPIENCGRFGPIFRIVLLEVIKSQLPLRLLNGRFVGGVKAFDAFPSYLVVALLSVFQLSFGGAFIFDNFSRHIEQIWFAQGPGSAAPTNNAATTDAAKYHSQR